MYLWRDTVFCCADFCRFDIVKDGTEWEETQLTGNEKIEDTVECISLSGRPGHNTIEVRLRAAVQTVNTRSCLVDFARFSLPSFNRSLCSRRSSCGTATKYIFLSTPSHLASVNFWTRGVWSHKKLVRLFSLGSCAEFLAPRKS